jgi:hypothetical protein
VLGLQHSASSVLCVLQSGGKYFSRALYCQKLAKALLELITVLANRMAVEYYLLRVRVLCKIAVIQIKSGTNEDDIPFH